MNFKIYTSYYGKLNTRGFDASRYCLISISRSVPPRVNNVLRCWEITPRESILSQYKVDGNEELYKEEFNKQLKSVSPYDLVQKLSRYSKESGGKDILLLCYEKPEAFCHRHLVAEWLNEYGVKVSEI